MLVEICDLDEYIVNVSTYTCDIPHEQCHTWAFPHGHYVSYVGILHVQYVSYGDIPYLQCKFQRKNCCTNGFEQ